MQKLECKPIVKELLKAGINYEDQNGLVNYFNSEAHAPPWDICLITRPQLRKEYWEAMVALQKELVPNYISVDDLYRSLWNLLKEVVLNGSEYLAREKLDAKINDFCSEVKKPLLSFDIIYEIKNFDVGERHFNLGNVEVFRLTPDSLQSLGLNAEASAMQANIFSDWVGKSVAKVEVNVSEINRAHESGMIKVNSALNVIRLVAVRERISQLDDEMFLWELGSRSIVIPKVRPEAGTFLSTSYYRGFRPLVIPMGDIIAKGLENENSWEYLIDGKLPQDIQVRLMRAIEWISHSVTANSLDYKLVDLCTALEILLLPNYTGGSKGALIALRQVLIGRGTSYTPEIVLYLYDKRSAIVHSGALNITNYSDYWNLLICCFQVLARIVRLSQRYPHIHELENLLGIVENKETLGEFIKHCKLRIYKGHKIRQIRKSAEYRFKKC